MPVFPPAGIILMGKRITKQLPLTYEIRDLQELYTILEEEMMDKDILLFDLDGTLTDQGWYYQIGSLCFG